MEPRPIFLEIPGYHLQPYDGEFKTDSKERWWVLKEISSQNSFESVGRITVYSETRVAAYGMDDESGFSSRGVTWHSSVSRAIMTLVFEDLLRDLDEPM